MSHQSRREDVKRKADQATLQVKLEALTDLKVPWDTRVTGGFVLCPGVNIRCYLTSGAQTQVPGV